MLKYKMRELVGMTLALAAMIGLVGVLSPLTERTSELTFADTPTDAPPITVVLDAGHGGEDGGAIGVNGVLEKDLNLSVASTVCDMLVSAGAEVVMTRTDDRLLYTEEQNVKGHRKEFDLRNRLELSEGYENGLLVSIHMNTFPQESCRGLQVYYSPNESSSRSLAAYVQESARLQLADSNTRKIKKAGSSIYLLHRSQNPAVMIECGFLSNTEECEKLSDEDYRRRLSFAIFCGIMEYINQK